MSNSQRDEKRNGSRRADIGDTMQLFDFNDQAQEMKALGGNPMVSLCGVGPAGSRCKDCAFLVKRKCRDRVYRKCIKRGITQGRETDHKAKFDACGKYQHQKSATHQEE
jgi:hypothetical protein